MRRVRLWTTMFALGLVALVTSPLATRGSAFRFGWAGALPTAPVSPRARIRLEAAPSAMQHRPLTRPMRPPKGSPAPEPKPSHSPATEAVRITVTVRAENASGTRFALDQNFPNPVEHLTTIRYEVARASHVSIKVYSVLGQHVATLVDESRSPGPSAVQWQARDTRGGRVAPGIYVYRMVASGHVLNRKLVVE